MKKATVMLLTLGTFVMASQARVDALGGNAAYWPGDEANVALFPQRVNDYNIAQFAGLGTGSTDHSGWVSWGEDTKYGFSWAEGSDNDMVDFWWGNGTMGVNFGLGMSSSDNGLAGDANVATSGMDLGVGFGMDMGFGELGVNFSNSTFDDGSDATADDPASMDVNVYLRRAQNVWMFDNMFFHFNFANDNTFYFDGNGDMCDMGSDGCNAMSSPDAQGTMALNLSFFKNVAIAEGTSGVFAMGFGFSSVSNMMGMKDMGMTQIAFPSFTFAVESGITDWATARVGLNKSFYLSNSVDYPAMGDVAAYTESSMGGTPLAYSFGLGFNYGSFNLDVDVTEDLYTNPWQKIVGFDGLGSTTATLTYVW